MKRSILFLNCITALCLTMAGCGSRLGREISIDGVDVSGLPLEEARALVEADQGAKLEGYSLILALDGEVLTLTAADLGIRADVEDALSRASELKRWDQGRNLSVAWYPDEESLTRQVELVEDRYRIDPEDAVLQVDFDREEPFSCSPGETGRAVEGAWLKERIGRAVAAKEAARIPVKTQTLPAEVTLQELMEGRQLIASFETSFHDSPYNAKNRVFNIKKAAKLINGITLEPGENFDCNGVLGDRNEENGWREAPGIVNGAYEQEYGGGVCQVSSTLFNAVMMADLTITERHPHSWPMGYVKIGRDATISTGGKNFCFTNSSQNRIYLSAWVDDEEDSLRVSIYGTPLPGGQHIEVASEETGKLEEPKTEILLDETLPAGTEQEVKKARQGRTSKTYKSRYDQEGNLIETVVAYEDVYRTIDGVTYVSADIYYS